MDSKSTIRTELAASPIQVSHVLFAVGVLGVVFGFLAPEHVEEQVRACTTLYQETCPKGHRYMKTMTVDNPWKTPVTYGGFVVMVSGAFVRGR